MRMRFSDHPGRVAVRGVSTSGNKTPPDRSGQRRGDSLVGSPRVRDRTGMSARPRPRVVQARRRVAGADGHVTGAGPDGSRRSDPTEREREVLARVGAQATRRSRRHWCSARPRRGRCRSRHGEGGRAGSPRVGGAGPGSTDGGANASPGAVGTAFVPASEGAGGNTANLAGRDDPCLRGIIRRRPRTGRNSPAPAQRRPPGAPLPRVSGRHPMDRRSVPSRPK